MSADVRLRILELTRPRTDNPDVGRWLKQARDLEAYVTGAGHADKAPAQPQPTLGLPTQDRTPAPSRGPARK